MTLRAYLIYFTHDMRSCHYLSNKKSGDPSLVQWTGHLAAYWVRFARSALNTGDSNERTIIVKMTLEIVL